MKAKLILIDRDESLMIHGSISASREGLSVLDDVREIMCKDGVACLANQFTALEMFGADQSKPVIFSGDRHAFFSHGICLPSFNQSIKTDEDKILDLFNRVIELVNNYNSLNQNIITTLTYDLDEMVIPKPRMLPILPKVIDLILSSKI
ncbi:hypothetical protein E7T06_16085 [Deinococcus sp. Arct2-2]|uniref:hypothetical protein n=1 Tax=Deinococcus sp. Arct2-2 TaxID=2568653 RepID=UPI0010A4A602|nr:hypothetical protein [Deinococcus sp. Arct2-2]THF68534.1 hypothetical protein E7T06_16085 [Deinococcus sp. Arct2-2]